MEDDIIYFNMKIAITSDIYYPMINGVAVFAHNLANGLAQKGHKVMVICPSFNGKHYKVKDKKTGVTTVYLRSIRFPFYPDQINTVPDKKKMLGMELPRLVYRKGIWMSPSPYREIKRALGMFRPDIIHNQTAETISLATLRYARKYDVPLVSTGHAYPDNITGQFRILKPIKRPVDAVLRAYMASFLEHSEYATMPTEMAIDDLVPKNRRRFKVRVEALSNGVDLWSFRPGKAKKKIYEKYEIDSRIPVALYVGRVDPEKSIKYVVEAFALGLKSGLEAQLVIVGDGTDKVKLMELAEELEIADRVKFLGKIVAPELMEIYRIGDVFVTASETETQGIVLIEAAATGLPLIAVDAGAVGELCQNKRNGFLCKPKDIKGLAKAMMKVLQDEDLQEKFGTESIEIAKLHDLNRTLERFEEIYEAAIELKSKKNKDVWVE